MRALAQLIRLQTSASGAVLAFYAAALLVLAMQMPWWRMESRAPQYGMRVLVVSVSPTGVSGDVKELDGLGHYVGMRTINTDAPIERKVAPYGVVLVALAAVALPFLRSRRLRVALAIPAVAVPLVFMSDLYAWQRYAVTNLDPTAALSMIANRVDARLYGQYAIAQFHVDASFQTGFWLSVVAAANVLAFIVTEWFAPRATSAAGPKSPPAASIAAIGAALLLLWSPARASAATIDVGVGARYPAIAQAIAAASPGDEIVVHAGTYREHLVVDRPLTLRAVGDVVVDGGGGGTVVKVTAGPTVVRGFTLRASGDSLLAEDAAIRVDGAPGSVVDHDEITDSLFGIMIVSSPGSRVIANHVAGKELILPRRGDGIRVFASDGAVVEDNVVEKSRDLSIWSSNHVAVRRNVVRRSRYGIHYMFCDDSLYEDNVFEHDQVGGAIMYSHRLILRRNHFEGSRGPSAHGLLIKGADDIIVESNWFLDNTRGLFLSDTPTSNRSACVIRANVIGGNETGLSLETSVSGVVFTDNAFIANRVQVEVLGTADGDQNTFSQGNRGNYWSDYVGFDADGDGIGDVPYRLEQFFEDLTDRWPAVGLLRLGPASQALELAARAFPIVKPRPTLTDRHPLVRPPASIARPAAGGGNPFLSVSGVVLSLGAGWVVARARRAFGSAA